MKNYIKLSFMTAIMTCSLSVSTMQDSQPLISKEEKNNFGIIGETKILKSHSSKIKLFAISHDSKYLATVSTEDACAKLWDLKTGKYLSEAITDPVASVWFSPDDKYLVARSWFDGTKIWLIENLLNQEFNKNTEKELQLESNPYSTALSHNGKYVVISFRFPVDICCIYTDHCSICLVDHVAEVEVIALSKDDYVVTSDFRGLVNAWDSKTGEHYDVAMSSHDLVTRTKTWDIPKCKYLHGLDTCVKKMAFSHDGNYLVTASKGTVKTWCLKRCECLYNLEDASKHSILRLGFSHDDKYLIIVLDSNTAKIFNPRTGRCLLTLNDVNDCAFSPDGNHIVTTKNEVAMILQLKNQDDFINKEKELNRFDLNISYLSEKFQKN